MVYCHLQSVYSLILTLLQRHMYCNFRIQAPPTVYTLTRGSHHSPLSRGSQTMNCMDIVAENGPRILAGFFVIFWVVSSLLKNYCKKRQLPPGPRGFPLIGNKHQVPSVKPWRKFEEWNKEYGEFSMFRNFTHQSQWSVLNPQDLLSLYISARRRS